MMFVVEYLYSATRQSHNKRSKKRIGYEIDYFQNSTMRLPRHWQPFTIATLQCAVPREDEVR